MEGPIDLKVWEDKLIGKKIIKIGSQVTDPTKEVSEVDIKHGVPAYRILTPNSMMTRDYREDRINVHVGQDDMICVKISIG